MIPHSFVNTSSYFYESQDVLETENLFNYKALITLYLLKLSNTIDSKLQPGTAFSRKLTLALPLLFVTNTFINSPAIKIEVLLFPDALGLMVKPLSGIELFFYQTSLHADTIHIFQCDVVG